MKIELRKGEWQEDYSKTIKERVARIQKRYDRLFKEDGPRMFIERFPLIVESIAMEFDASITCGPRKGDYLLNFLEAYDGKIFKDVDIPRQVVKDLRKCPVFRGGKTLNEAVQRYEDFHGESIGKADFLFELSEALKSLEGCESAAEWVDKWFFYYNMV